MTGVNYETTSNGTTAHLDGEPIGTFPTMYEAQRAIHYTLRFGVVNHQRMMQAGLIPPDDTRNGRG